MVLSSTLPSVGPGALKNREDPKVLGTSKVRRDHTLDDISYKKYCTQGIRLVASCKPLLQDFCDRMFARSGFCGYVSVQFCIPRCCQSW